MSIAEKRVDEQPKKHLGNMLDIDERFLTNIDQIKVGDIMGVIIEESYAIAVVEKNNTAIIPADFFRMRLADLRLRCLKADAKGVWKRDKTYLLFDAFIGNLFQLPEKDVKKWKLLEGV